MDIIFHNVNPQGPFPKTQIDVVFKIKKFSQKRYLVKILQIQDNIWPQKSCPTVIYESKFSLSNQKKIIQKIMSLEKDIDYSFIRCNFNKGKISFKDLIKVIMPNNIKNIKKRKIKIEKFLYSSFDELDQRTAILRIENILKVSMYNPDYVLCKNIMKRYYFNQ